MLDYVQSDAHTVRETWGPCKYSMAAGHEIICEVSIVAINVNSAKKEKKIYAEMETISLMDYIGMDMLLLCNNQLDFSSIFQKDLNMKKLLHYFVQE